MRRIIKYIPLVIVAAVVAVAVGATRNAINEVAHDVHQLQVQQHQPPSLDQLSTIIVDTHDKVDALQNQLTEFTNRVERLETRVQK